MRSSFTCTFFCVLKKLWQQWRKACREIYRSHQKAKAYSKNNSSMERLDSRVQHIWRFRVIGSCSLIIATHSYNIYLLLWWNRDRTIWFNSRLISLTGLCCKQTHNMRSLVTTHICNVYLYNNKINARVLIGQSAMVYCAGKPIEKSRVLWIIIYKQ